MKDARLVDRLRRAKTNESFRSEAVRLAKLSTKSVPMIAKELGIGSSTLYRWIANDGVTVGYSKDIALSGREDEIRSHAITSIDDKPSELERLKEEVAFLKEENDILRRAALAFARAGVPAVSR